MLKFPEPYDGCSSNDSKNSSFGVNALGVVEGVARGRLDLDLGLEDRVDFAKGVGVPSGR